MYRYADVLLKKAEALNEMGQPGQAAAPLNIVRKRAGLPEVSGLSQEAMREKIIHERRMELAFEGHRWFDLRRYAVCEKYPYSKQIRHAFNVYDGNKYEWDHTDIYVLSMASFFIGILTFCGIGWLAWKYGRIWCNTVCPVGTLLGFFIALFFWADTARGR